MKRRVFLGFSTAVLAGCGGKPAGPAAEPFAGWVHEDKVLKQTRPLLTISASYPVFTAGGEEAARRAVNDAVAAQAVNMLAQAEDKSFDQAAAEFFERTEQYRKEAPDAPKTEWARTVEAKVAGLLPKTISISFVMDSYEGGAHPNQNTVLRVFRTANGAEVPLGAVLRGPADAELNRIAEPYFRKARELKPEANLTEEGFTFEKGFALNENYALTREGLLFHFDAYEVGAYAMGPTDFTVPYAALTSRLKPEYLPAS